MSVSCNTFIENDEQHFVYLLHIYTDKSVTSMRGTELTFSPLHTNVLNITDSARREHILSGYTILSYLPDTFVHSKDHSFQKPGPSTTYKCKVLNALLDRRERFSNQSKVWLCKDIQ